MSRRSSIFERFDSTGDELLERIQHESGLSTPFTPINSDDLYNIFDSYSRRFEYNITSNPSKKEVCILLENCHKPLNSNKIISEFNTFIGDEDFEIKITATELFKE